MICKGGNCALADMVEYIAACDLICIRVDAGGLFSRLMRAAALWAGSAKGVRFCLLPIRSEVTEHKTEYDALKDPLTV